MRCTAIKGKRNMLQRAGFLLTAFVPVAVLMVMPSAALPGVDAGTTPVPRTGQGNCYDSKGNSISCKATGQDADYLRGVDMPDPRFTDRGDGTVIDNATDLVWTKDAQLLKKTMKWEEGLAACNNLDFAGHTDWRLPNVRELLSLIDYGAHDPALPPGHPFSNVQLLFYWTSTTYEGTADHAWGVYVYNGYVYNYHKMTRAWVWPVRGGR